MAKCVDCLVQNVNLVNNKLFQLISAKFQGPQRGFSFYPFSAQSLFTTGTSGLFYLAAIPKTKQKLWCSNQAIPSSKVYPGYDLEWGH